MAVTVKVKTAVKIGLLFAGVFVVTKLEKGSK